MANLSRANAVLNPKRFQLSSEARKRLGWIYSLEYDCGKNVTRASKKIGISREWLNKVYRIFRSHDRDPRSLEPRSRAPHSRVRRKRISEKTEQLIICLRKTYPAWGKEKFVRLLKRDHGTVVSSSTVGRYLKKHHLTNVRLATKNTRAAQTRALSLKEASLRERPPQGLADAAPGSLMAKDMKLIPKLRQNPSKTMPTKDRRDAYFWYQHTGLDSCSRYRIVSYARTGDAKTARDAFEEAVKRLPFSVAALLSDNGGENAGAFHARLVGKDVLHFWSRQGTPTDNPRVERSHRSDDDEFFSHNRNARRSFDALVAEGHGWEETWNTIRPHQALGYLTPKEFCDLWKRDPSSAQNILATWKSYMAKQSRRLRTSRKEKRLEKIHALNTHLEATLGPSFTPLKV